MQCSNLSLLHNMKHLLILAFVALFTCKASAQKSVKAEDAAKYIGKEKWIEGTITSFAGPGYVSSTFYYIGSDTTKKGLSVQIPIQVWSKSPKLASSTLKGKLIEVHGIIESIHHQPSVLVRDTADVKIIQ
jgi:hypothetical protein